MRSVFPNIRHMRVFVAAADTGSVSAAADRCHLSQPAATQAITQLEKNLGVTLIISTTVSRKRSVSGSKNWRSYQ